MIISTRTRIATTLISRLVPTPARQPYIFRRNIMATSSNSNSNDNNSQTNQPPSGQLRFGPFDVTTQVFLTTPSSFALVNLKPLLPGHVLVCPRTPHRRLTDLTANEVTDLFGAVQRVQLMLARYYFTTITESSSSSTQITPSLELEAGGSFNIAIQDGVEAGQTVPHVHVHVIPRIRGVTAKDSSPENNGVVGDAIYELMAAEAGNVGGALWDRVLEERPRPGGGFPRVEDPDRLARSMADMEAEAEAYRGVLAGME